MKTSKEKILQKIKNIKAIPVSASKVINLFQSQYPDINEIIKVIEYDSGLTANILKLVNSSRYAAKQPISSLRDAIVRIGQRNLFDMVVGSSMSSILKSPVKGYDIPAGELWKSAVMGAVYTDVIKDKLDIKLPACAFTAALLRDVGKIVLGVFLGVDAMEIIKLAKSENITFEEAEREYIGFDHSDAGAILLEHWKIPSNITVPVRWHHHPELYKEEDIVTEIVHIADALVILGGTGTGIDGLNYRISDKVFQKYGFSEEMCESLIYEGQLKFNSVWDDLNK